MPEEVFWAGDKEAEGAIKALATAEELDYERKGIDPEPGRNYTRLMICSNEDWVVPAGSGGRRWFVLRVGNEHEQDNAYFAAIDKEMEGGGLAAMLYDLQRSPLAKTVNVRKAPVTPWLIEQRLHSQDARKVWWRSVLAEGGSGIDVQLPGDREFIQLDKTGYVSVRRDDIFASARPFFERKGRPATREAVRSSSPRNWRAIRLSSTMAPGRRRGSANAPTCSQATTLSATFGSRSTVSVSRTLTRASCLSTPKQSARRATTSAVRAG